jgi:peroxiredoxin Q/BCP
VQVLGASFDTPEKNAEFAKKYGFNFPLLSDTDRTLALAFGAAERADAGAARRVSALIDGEGKVLKLYPKVDAGAHPDEVLRDIR